MMELEIESQSSIIDELVKKYIVNYCVLIDIPLNINKIVLVASGSSYNAALCAKYFFENISNVQTSVEYACEFMASSLDNYNADDALYIFVSQSGNSYDTVEAFKKIKQKGIKTLCITNNIESYLYREADFKFDIQAGREYAIAATKTFGSSVFMLWIIAIKIAQNKQIDITGETKDIYSIKSYLSSIKDNVENIGYASKLISKHSDFSIIGFGINYPLSREAALKIKETCYINTSSYPMGEFIHGHFALLNKSKLLFTILREEHQEKEIEILKKILTTYKTKSILITDGWEDFGCDIMVKIPKTELKIASTLAIIMTIQLIALESAKILKRNVDKPKGLNKVVDRANNKENQE